MERSSEKNKLIRIVATLKEFDCWPNNHNARAVPLEDKPRNRSGIFQDNIPFLLQGKKFQTALDFR